LSEKTHRRNRKTIMVASCEARPAMRTLMPTSFVFPSQLLDDAMPDPEACTRKETMSMPTKILVILVGESPKSFWWLSGRTARAMRPRRR
jgi:hypothetical protein